MIDGDASERQRNTAEVLIEDAYHRIGRPRTTTTWVLEVADPAGTIIEQSQYYGLTIIGAPTKGRLRRFISGSTNQSVRANAQSMVLSARNNSHNDRL